MLQADQGKAKHFAFFSRLKQHQQHQAREMRERQKKRELEERKRKGKALATFTSVAFKQESEMPPRGPECRASSEREIYLQYTYVS